MQLEKQEIKVLQQFRKEGLAWKGWPVLFWTVGALFVLMGVQPMPPGDPDKGVSLGLLGLGIFFLWSGGEERRDQALHRLVLKLADTGTEGEPQRLAQTEGN